MKSELFQLLKPGNRFFAKTSDGKVRDFLVMTQIVQVYLSDSPANVIEVSSGRFAIVLSSPQPSVYPKKYVTNRVPKAEKMETTQIHLY